MWTPIFLLVSCVALPSTNAAWMFPLHHDFFPAMRPAFGMPFFPTSWMPRFDEPRLSPSNWIMPDFSSFMDTFPKVPKVPTTLGSVCRPISDVAGLKFPPHSEIPTDKIDPNLIVKNEVKHTTYLCRDTKNNYFYKLLTESTFATPDIKNEQTTVKYYTTDKKPIDSSDMVVDKDNLWQRKEPSSTFMYAKYWPASPKVEDAVKCVPTDNDESLPYPNVPDPSTVELNGERIVARDVQHTTQLCSTKDSSYQYYMLETKLTVKTDRGSSSSRMASISHPKSGTNPQVYSSSYSSSGSYSNGNKN